MDTLKCEGVSKNFDGVQALEDVSLRFAEPGLVAIVGPNGAGKSTLFNVLTGLLRPDAGKCFVGEEETTGLAPHRIAQLGVSRTFQELRLIQGVSVLDNVLVARPNQRGEHLWHALTRFGVATEEAHNRQEAMRHLRSVGLDRMATELAGELSYGQQKLLTLACCMATDAEILLLDEPVAGVFPAVASEILEQLRELQHQGKLVLFIEHDIDAVREIAGHVIVMDCGRIIAEGRPLEVLDRPEIVEAYVS